MAKRKPRLLVLVLGLLAIFVVGGGFALIRGILSASPPQSKKVVQEIHVIRPPPPPPDAPPPPPPPPDEKVDVHDPEPEPDPTPSNEPPPSEQLGLDAEGSAGGDGFGLAARKGGRDLLATGGSAYAWYGGLLKDQILEELGSETKARNGAYSASLKVWVRADGSFERIRLAQSTGNPERDRAIEAALSRLGRAPQAPPPDMPQPITIRIVSHG